MKYKFITILHNLKLNQQMNKGIELYPGTRISNGKEKLSSFINTNLFARTAGQHSYSEFEDKVYCYKVGEYKEIESKGNMVTFHFLREIEQFIHALWYVKDNSIYIRDGFLFFYEDDIENGVTYKASLSTMYTSSDGSRSETYFSKEEVSSALSYFTPFTLEEINEETFGGKYVENDHFYKKANLKRHERVKYFVVAARATNALPMKIVMYCTALECLFSTGSTEIVHKISERVAVLLGKTADEKIEIFDFVKKAYNYRSTVIHGSAIKADNGGLLEISMGLDQILRQFLLMEDHEVFKVEERELDSYLSRLLFE